MLSRSRTSDSISPNARPSAARKQTEPVPVGLKSVATWSVIAADGSANSASRLGGTGLVRPSSASRNPTYYLPCLRLPDGTATVRRPSRLPAELLGDLVKLRQPLLERRGGGEQRGQAPLTPPARERPRRKERAPRPRPPPNPGGGPWHVAPHPLHPPRPRRRAARPATAP